MCVCTLTGGLLFCVAFDNRGGPITSVSFNRTGTVFAYTVSYDWSQGHSGAQSGTVANQQAAVPPASQPNKIMLHALKDDEIKKRPKVAFPSPLSLFSPHLLILFTHLYSSLPPLPLHRNDVLGSSFLSLYHCIASLFFLFFFFGKEPYSKSGLTGMPLSAHNLSYHILT